ncbi:MAG: universal stress protein [Thermoleophilia bacterium]
MPSSDAARPVVVGVDDSPGSVAALRFALREAALRGALLRVVHAWTVPALGEAAGMVPLLLDDLRREEHAVLDRAIEQATDGGRPDVDLQRVLVEDPPGRALIEAAHDAQLVVVGSRGRGGFAGLLLGSVSQQVAHHAPCPVVIVPATGQ